MYTIFWTKKRLIFTRWRPGPPGPSLCFIPACNVINIQTFQLIYGFESIFSNEPEPKPEHQELQKIVFLDGLVFGWDKTNMNFGF